MSERKLWCLPRFEERKEVLTRTWGGNLHKKSRQYAWVPDARATSNKS